MIRRFPLLLRRGRLQPRESLSSFVVRLAQLNYYNPVTILNRLCLEGLEKDRLDWPSNGETYERLFALTWIDPYKLHDATGHFFAEALTPPGVQLESLPVPGGEVLPVLAQKTALKQLRPDHAVQFCPLCLKKTRYHRIAWMPVAIAACITHKRLLVDQCPECQRKVSTRDVVEYCRCRRCRTDFKEVRSASLRNDVFGLLSQRFIRWCLKLGRAPVDSLSHRLPRQHSQAWLYIFIGLVDSIRLLGSDWDYMHQPITRSPMKPFGCIRNRPTPDQSYRLYATAFKALLKWPQGFHEFLRAYTSRGNEKARGSMFKDLGKLYSRWLSEKWTDPVFDFMQKAFSDYLVDTYVTSPSTIQKCDSHAMHGTSPALAFISTSRAARLLGVSVRTIKRLTDVGFLVKYTAEQGEPRRYGFVRQDEVLILCLQWRETVLLEDAIEWLGLTRSIVVDMVKVGLLTVEHNPDVNGSEQWVFNKQSLDRCYCQVTQGAKISGRSYSSLAEVTRTLSVFGLRVVDILKLVTDGKLKGWIPTESSALAKLTFDTFDVETLLESPEPGLGLLNSEDAARRLGIESRTFFRWVSADLILPVIRYAYEEYFDPNDIDHFLTDKVSSAEAAEMLGVEVNELEEWCWYWGLDALKGTMVDGCALYLFRREDVERLKTEFFASS